MIPSTLDGPFTRVNSYGTGYLDLDTGWQLEFGWLEIIYG